MRRHQGGAPELEQKPASKTAPTPAPPPIVQPTVGFGRGRGFSVRKAEASELPRDIAEPKGRAMGRGRGRGAVMPKEPELKPMGRTHSSTASPEHKVSFHPCLDEALGNKPEAPERTPPGYISALSELRSSPPSLQEQQTLPWPKPGPALSSPAAAKVYSRAVREPLLPPPPAGCWNCHRQGHSYQRCPYERGIFCFGCGRPAVRLSQCSRCVHAWRRGEIGPHDPPGQEPRLPPAEIVWVKPDTLPPPPITAPQIESPPTPLALTAADNANRASNSREWSPDDPFIQALATAIMRKL